MAKRKIIRVSDTEVYPITHDSCVFSSDGVAIPYRYVTKDSLTLDSNFYDQRIEEIRAFALILDKILGDSSHHVKGYTELINSIKQRSDDIDRDISNLLRSRHCEGEDFYSLLDYLANYNILTEEYPFYSNMIYVGANHTNLTSTNSILVDGTVYVMHGYSTAVTKYCSACDLISKTGVKITDCPIAKQSAGLCHVNGVIYSVGGYTTADYAGFYRYDTDTDTWTIRASSYASTRSYLINYDDLHLYQWGGSGGCKRFYDIPTNTWTILATPLPETLYPSVVLHEGLMYVFNGSTSASTYCYDPMTETWSARKSCPIGGEFCSATLWNDSAIVCKSGSRSIYRYHFSDDAWELLPYELDTYVKDYIFTIHSLNEYSILLEQDGFIYQIFLDEMKG